MKRKQREAELFGVAVNHIDGHNPGDTVTLTQGDRVQLVRYITTYMDRGVLKQYWLARDPK